MPFECFFGCTCCRAEVCARHGAAQDEYRAAEVSGATDSSTNSTAGRETLKESLKNYLEEVKTSLHVHVLRIFG
jgi:hypothetical protein